MKQSLVLLAAFLLTGASPAGEYAALVIPAEAKQQKAAGYKHHPIYDHPKAKQHLAQAALTGQAVIDTGYDGNTPVTWTFRPNGLIDRTVKQGGAGSPPAKSPGPALTARPTHYQQPRQGVAAPRPFPSGTTYDPDHTCNNCGAERWVVDGWNGDGTHTHICRRCGNSWKH